MSLKALLACIFLNHKGTRTSCGNTPLCLCGEQYAGSFVQVWSPQPEAIELYKKS